MRRAVILLVLLVGATGALSFTREGMASSITPVNSTVDSDDLDALAENSTCDLREAILAANTDETVGQCAYSDTPTTAFDTIRFSIPGDGPHQINIDSPLPEITDTVRIDGLTQPGASCTPRNLLIVLHGSENSGDALVYDGSHASEVWGLVINGFGGAAISAGGIENFVLHCSHIGTDAAATVAVPNDYGVNVADGGLIGFGGDTPNVISGNLIYQVGVYGAATVQGNLIGTNLAGDAALGGGTGISAATAFASNAVIGGVNPDSSNVISGLGGAAMAVSAPVTISFTGNTVGLDLAKTNLVPNQSGIRVDHLGARVLLYRNAMDGNGGLALDLGDDGVTGNDDGDADIGPNTLQNFPVITVATPGLISGNTNGFAAGTYEVQLFHSPECDASGYGEGRTYLGTLTDVQPDTDFQFVGDVPGDLPNYGVITATAFEVNTSGSSSEFSLCKPVLLDVDCNGDTEMGDALAILNVLAGLTSDPQPQAPCSADVDPNIGVTIDDVLVIRRFVAGL